MQNPWGHLVLTRESGASYNDYYEVHWINKDHNTFRHPKRDGSCQSSGWSLCPASDGGGCCPSNYACGDSSCYATTAGPTTACDKAGYYNCPLTAGAGSCCPVGYICQAVGDQCIPSDGQSQSCPVNYFACPSSLGYGCCQDGMACGSGVCYDTTPTTLPVSSTLTTTNSNGDTITTAFTTTEVITPGPDISTGAYATIGVPKLVPSTVSKLPAVESNSSSNSGDLSTGALGGIVAGVIVLLLAIVATAVFIIRRLRRTERAAQAAAESRRDTSTGQPTNSHVSGSHKSGFGQPSTSEVDGMDLKRTRLSPHMRSQSDSTVGDRSQSLTPKFMIAHGGDGSSRTSSPPTWGQGIFNTVPPSDASDGRQSSLDTYGGGTGTYHGDNNDVNNTRYSQQTVQRVSYESQASSYPGNNGRHWSNASEVVGSANGAHGVSELDTSNANEAASRRRSSSSTTVTRPGLSHVRRSSDPAARSRSESSGGSGGAAVVPQPPLGTVSEIPLELHGYYGPEDLARGQTAARLAKGEEPSSVGGTAEGRPS